MRKVRFVAGAELWPTLLRAAQHAPGRKQVATAYVGAGSLKALELRAGDAVHCALSVAHAAAGAVDARELLALHEQEVLIYASEPLHAKVYDFGDRVFVGSANASQRSWSLDEAMLETRDAATIAEVRSWFAERQLKAPVTRLELEACCKAYRPPAWYALAGGSGDGPRGRRQIPQPSQGARWWIALGIAEDSRRDEDEEAAARAHQRAVAAGAVQEVDELEDLRLYDDTALTRDVREGDWLIQVMGKGDGRRVYAAQRCHAVERYKRRSGRPQTMVSLDASASVSAPFDAFVRAAREQGVPVQTHRGGCFTDPKHLLVLEQLASPRGLKALARKRPTAASRHAAIHYGGVTRDVDAIQAAMRAATRARGQRAR